MAVERLFRLAADPDSETFFYVSFDNTIGSGITELLSLGFGKTTPTLICQECASDVGFVADDGFFLSGDTDLDRDADITDFTKLLSNFGPVEFVGPVSAVNFCYEGDLDGDWEIDLTDFSNHFLPKFNATGESTYGPSQSIPEPSTLLSLRIGGMLLALVVYWRRRR